MRFKKLDTNSDNSLDRNEFIAGAPDGVSSDQAGQLFDKLDSKGKGALSQDDLATAFQQMGASMQSTLLQAQESQSTQASQGNDGDGDGDGSTQASSGHHHHGRPDPAKMFSKLDADGDGTVTKDEFLAGRPDDVSEDQAGAFYDKIAANSGADSTATGLTKDQFVAGLEKSRPDQTQAASSDQSSSSLSGDQTSQLIDQLLALIQSQLSSSSSSSNSAGQSSQSGDHGPPDPAKMFSTLDANHDGTVTKDEFQAGRPDDVSEDQAGAFYDKIASASGADGTTGLSQDQLAAGMKKAGPPGAPGDSTATASQTSSLSSNTDLLLQDLLKAIGSYQKANQTSAASTVLAA